MILADKIVSLRKKAGWSQEDLAEKLVIGARSLAFADRRVAVVNCDLAGFVGLEEVPPVRIQMGGRTVRARYG